MKRFIASSFSYILFLNHSLWTVTSLDIWFSLAQFIMHILDDSSMNHAFVWWMSSSCYSRKFRHRHPNDVTVITENSLYTLCECRRSAMWAMRSNCVGRWVEIKFAKISFPHRSTTSSWFLKIVKFTKAWRVKWLLPTPATIIRRNFFTASLTHRKRFPSKRACKRVHWEMPAIIIIAWKLFFHIFNNYAIHNFPLNALKKRATVKLKNLVKEFFILWRVNSVL